MAALEPFTESIFARARKQGRRESYEAYAADALVALAEHGRTCDEKPTRKAPHTLVRVLVDHRALDRGHTDEGEVCEIEGIGPIPVATAKALATDSILAALATDGVDIYSVSHMGRAVTARQRTALEVRDPCCVVPGCDVHDHLEIDHITERKELGPTRLADLGRLCPWHHYLETYKGFRLLGGPGKWRFEPPRERAGPDPPPAE